MINFRCCEDFAGQISPAEWTSGSQVNLVKLQSSSFPLIVLLRQKFRNRGYATIRAVLSFFQQVGGFNGQCEMYLKKFEDPKQNDPMSRMQNDLDETKIVLVRTLFKMNIYLFALLVSNLTSSPAQYN